MVGESPTQLAVKQHCLVAEKELKRLVKRWDKRVDKLKSRGIGLASKHVILKKQSKLTLIIDVEPSRNSVHHQRKWIVKG